MAEPEAGLPKMCWDPQSLAWFSGFSRYTGFHEKLAGLLLPWLAGCRTLCDAGCGPGFLDLYLAGSLKQVTCVDRSEEALAFLRRACALRGIQNLTVLESDWEAVEGDWDAVLFSFFGTGLVERVLPRCGRLLLVMGDEDTHGLLPGKRPRRQSARRLEALLGEKGLCYSVQRTKLEAGQPFSSREEAFRFVRRYSGCTGQEAEEFLEARLISLEGGEFSHYLPRSKPLALFTIPGFRR